VLWVLEALTSNKGGFCEVIRVSCTVFTPVEMTRSIEGAFGLNPSKVRVRLETAIAACAGILGVITIIWHDWIEALTGWDPDHHNGTFEWLIVAALLAVAIVLGVVARRHWQALAAPTAR
jgi:hypothetical protein